MAAEGQQASSWLSNTALAVNGEAISLAEVLTHAKWKNQLSFYQGLTDAVLIRQAAHARGLSVTAEELQHTANSFRYAHQLTDSAAAKAWLVAHHLTVREWERMLALDVLTGKLREAVTAEQIEPYFAEHRLTFDAAILSRLVVQEEEVARELRLQIVEEGAYFYALARRYSLDAATRPMGGYVGAVGRAALPAAAEAAVFSAQAGAVVGPYKLPEGWALLRVESLQPATLDDATRVQIRQRLFDEWLQDARTKAQLATPLLSGT